MHGKLWPLNHRVVEVGRDAPLEIACCKYLPKAGSVRACCSGHGQVDFEYLHRWRLLTFSV